MKIRFVVGIMWPHDKQKNDSTLSVLLCVVCRSVGVVGGVVEALIFEFPSSSNKELSKN